MHESSLFPLTDGASAGAADGDGGEEASLTPLLLPPYILRSGETDYSCRLLLLTGLDTDHCDAAEIAYAVQLRLDHIYEHHLVEAVVIHRSRRLVLVVLGSTEALKILLQEPPEIWVQAFGRQTSLARAVISSAAGPSSSATEEDALESQQPEPERALRLSEWCNFETLEYTMGLVARDLARCGEHETTRMVRCLTGLCALVRPDTVWRGDFSDRALLLSGTRAGSTTMSALGLVLSGVGLLDDLVLFAVRRVALAVFHSADAAAALLQEPTASWIAMGFEDCRRALDAEDAAVTANEVHLLLLVVQGLGPAFLG